MKGGVYKANRNALTLKIKYTNRISLTQFYEIGMRDTVGVAQSG